MEIYNKQQVHVTQLTRLFSDDSFENTYIKQDKTKSASILHIKFQTLQVRQGGSKCWSPL